MDDKSEGSNEERPSEEVKERLTEISASFQEMSKTITLAKALDSLQWKARVLREVAAESEGGTRRIALLTANALGDINRALALLGGVRLPGTPKGDMETSRMTREETRDVLRRVRERVQGLKKDLLEQMGEEGGRGSTQPPHSQ